VSALVVDVRYEAEWLYGSITYDSIDGQKLISCYGPGGSPTRAIELLEDQDDNGSKCRSKTQSLIHHLLSQGHL
jgi:hypothetical protein